MIIQTTKLTSGGILAPVFGGVNGVVQWGRTPMVCTHHVRVQVSTVQKSRG